jgi:hypothetical protein
MGGYYHALMKRQIQKDKYKKTENQRGRGFTVSSPFFIFYFHSSVDSISVVNTMETNTGE